MLASFKAVFFDAGGTLLHPYPSVGEIYFEVASRYGCRTPAGVLESKFRDAWLKRDGIGNLASHSNEKVERDWWKNLVFEVFSETLPGQNFEKFFAELYDLFAQPQVWRLYPGVHELLENLKNQKKRLAIISNWDSRLFKICAGLDIEKYFDFILASAVFGASKPSPLIFQEALRRTGVLPHEAVHIGDSLADDIHGAHQVGIHAIHIDRHPDVPKDLHLKHHRIHQLNELLSA